MNKFDKCQLSCPVSVCSDVLKRMQDEKLRFDYQWGPQLVVESEDSAFASFEIVMRPEGDILGIGGITISASGNGSLIEFTVVKKDATENLTRIYRLIKNKLNSNGLIVEDVQNTTQIERRLR